MESVPVLIFETNYQNHELWRVALNQQGCIADYVLILVPLRRGTALPVERYFLRILELHRPKLLITSWRYIGPAVRKAKQTMVGQRPLEKWIVSGYSTQQLEKQAKVSGWADMIYERPISPLYLAAEVKRRLASLLPSSSSIVSV